MVDKILTLERMARRAVQVVAPERFRAENDLDDYGLEHGPGGPHRRAFVGPPADYDMIAGISFGLLFAAGMRETHHLLDLGCGSLRVGRLLIPYLRRYGYCGVEPNKWLVQEAIKHELGRDLIRLKQPQFSSSSSFEVDSFHQEFDWVLAQSIFSHTYADMASQAFERLARVLPERGVLLGTFQEGAPTIGSGWLYPACVPYSPAEFYQLLDTAGLASAALEWPHPRQRWFVAGVDAARVEAVRERVADWP